MAHKRGLDGTYLQPSLEQYYAEFFKAVSDLTIEDTERLRATNKILEKEKSELRIKNEELLEYKEKVDQLWSERDRLEHVLAKTHS